MSSTNLPRTDPFAAALEAHQGRRARLLERYLGPAESRDAPQGTTSTAAQQESAQDRSGSTS